MAIRSTGSVTVAFGLVSIAVKIYTATESKSAVSFNYLHAACKSRVKQQFTCPTCMVPVPREELVKGYEFTKDQYVTVTAEELKSLEEAASQTVEIMEFVPAETVDALYYDKGYLLAPDKGAAKAYALLAAAMRKSGRVAIAKYAARGKQHIVQLRPAEGGIVMQQLYYAPEVRGFEDVTIEKATVSDAELTLAEQLINSIAAPAFDASRYEDQVATRIKAALDAKVEGKEITVAATAASPTTSVVDLMAVLQASLGATAKPAAVPTKSKRKAKEAA